MNTVSNDFICSLRFIAGGHKASPYTLCFVGAVSVISTKGRNLAISTSYPTKLFACAGRDVGAVFIPARLRGVGQREEIVSTGMTIG
jgi:hypothetical protein